MTNEEAVAKILAGLKHHEVYIVDYARRIHAIYPLDKIDSSVVPNITVPVALPVAMMLLGLAAAQISNQVVPPAPEKDVGGSSAP